MALRDCVNAAENSAAQPCVVVRVATAMTRRYTRAGRTSSPVRGDPLWARTKISFADCPPQQPRSRCMLIYSRVLMRRAGIWLGTLATVAVIAAPAPATPIAHNDQERALYGGRVIPEPMQSVDYLQFGSNGSEAELADAFKELQRI